MLGPSLSRWLTTYLILPITAVPYANKHPDGYAIKGARIVMTRPNPTILTGTQMCQDYYSEFFKRNRVLRTTFQRQNELDPYYVRDFTHYPRNSPPDGLYIGVPVEAVMGEVFASVNWGYKQGLWGCYVACQDLRKTLEWLLSARMLRARHIRLKTTFSLLCPEGMISRTITRLSHREYETAEEIAEAMDHWKIMEKKTKLDNQMNYHLLVNGDTDAEITDCECFVPTGRERKEALDKYIDRFKPEIVKDLKRPSLATSRMPVKKKPQMRGIVHEAREDPHVMHLPAGEGTSEPVRIMDVSDRQRHGKEAELDINVEPIEEPDSDAELEPESVPNTEDDVYRPKIDFEPVDVPRIILGENGEPEDTVPWDELIGSPLIDMTCQDYDDSEIDAGDEEVGSTMHNNEHIQDALAMLQASVFANHLDSWSSSSLKLPRPKP